MDGLFYSGNEDYKDVSEILQNKLYYEAETLEMVLKVVSFYKDQSIQYLDAVVHLAYVMLRMLEKYSKNQDYIFVKKKAAKRGKKKQAEGAAGEARSAFLLCTRLMTDGPQKNRTRTKRWHLTASTTVFRNTSWLLAFSKA